MTTAPTRHREPRRPPGRTLLAGGMMAFGYLLLAFNILFWFTYDTWPPDWLVWWPATWLGAGRVLEWMDAHDS